MYEARCCFCKRIHRSEYWDELEEEILACRDIAEEWRKGRLDTYKDPQIRPISCETAAYIGETAPYIGGYV